MKYYLNLVHRSILSKGEGHHTEEGLQDGPTGFGTTYTVHGGSQQFGMRQAPPSWDTIYREPDNPSLVAHEGSQATIFVAPVITPGRRPLATYLPIKEAINELELLQALGDDIKELRAVRPDPLENTDWI